jgi:hypothetical protein
MAQVVEDKINLMNTLARGLAKEKGITEVQALTLIKNEFMDRHETTETIKGMSIPARLGDYSGNGGSRVPPEDAYGVVTEQSRVEMRKLELEQKRLEADQKKADLEARKLELAEKKIESEERLQREKMEREDKYKQDQIMLDRERLREDANYNRQMLMMNMGGKKPDEMMEFLKTQSQVTSEFYKAQGEGQRGLYDTLLKAKDSERDREMTWKTELAKIEADREVELAKLRQEDSKTAGSTELLVNMLAEGFEKLGDRLTANKSGDILAQIEEHNKFNQSLLKVAMPMLKAQGLSDDQLDVVKKQVGLEEKRQEGTIDKLWTLGKLVWKDYVAPAADKAVKELDAAPSGLEPKISPETEKRIRQETEAKAREIAAENAYLQQQLEEEKKRILILQEKRKKLESRANELGIHYDDSMSNNQLFDWIESQEAVLEQQKAASDRYAVQERARRVKITQIPQTSAENANDVHEKQEIYKAAVPSEPVIEASDAVIPQENRVPDDEPATPTDDSLANLKINIQEELAKTFETSDETKEFMEQAGVPGPDILDEKVPETTKTDKTPRKRGGKRKDNKLKERHQFTIYKEDGTEIARVESIDHRGAGLKIANELKGTVDKPVRIKVADEAEVIKQYDAYSAELENKSGAKYPVPRVKEVK